MALIGPLAAVPDVCFDWSNRALLRMWRTSVLPASVPLPASPCGRQARTLLRGPRHKRVKSVFYTSTLILHANTALLLKLRSSCFLLPESPLRAYCTSWKYAFGTLYFLPPVSYFRVPKPRFQVPTSYLHVPTSYFQVPKSFFQVPKSYFQVPESYFQVPESYFPVPESCSQVPRSYPQVSQSHFQVRTLYPSCFHTPSSCSQVRQ